MDRLRALSENPPQKPKPEAPKPKPKHKAPKPTASTERRKPAPAAARPIADDGESMTFRAGQMGSDLPPLASRRARREYELLQERRSLRPSILLTALGTIVPGGGLALGRKRRGLGYVMLTGAIIALITLTYLLLTRNVKSLVLEMGSKAGLVQQIFWGGLILSLVWIGSVILTAVTNKPKRLPWGKSAVLAVFTALMCATLAYPSYYVLSRVRAHQEVLATSFKGKSAKQKQRDAEKGVVAPNTDKKDPWEGTDRVNLLLLGSDTRHEGDGVRTDSMMVASINTQSGETVLIGVPRNLQDVPFPKDSPLHDRFPNGFNCPERGVGNECLMNGVWMEAEGIAENDPKAFEGDPNPGLTATQDAISEVLGLRIDNTLIIDFDGFTALVDAMGGVTINIRNRIPMGKAEVDANGVVHAKNWLEPGTRKLTGYQALWYSRSRKADSDYGRMRRQRCMVGALIKQSDPVKVMNRYNDLAEVMKNNISFDIEASQLPAWVTLAERMQKSDIKVLTLTADVINPARPDFDKIHGLVDKALETGDPESAVESAKSADKPKSTKTSAPGTPAPTASPKPGKTTPAPAPTDKPAPTEVKPEADMGGDIFDAC